MSDTALSHPGQGGKGLRAYVLGALTLVYTFNFIDRTLLSIVQEPIRQEFHLLDWQLGLLGGPAFALLYTVLGIPIARWAERSNRITIISIGLALWSAATAACGYAGSYAQLFVARSLVGIGEAAGSPPSHSVMSDYFPAKRRASALAIYSLGIPIGTMLAAIGGAWLYQNAGNLAHWFGPLAPASAPGHPSWRAAFLVLGLPGVLLAILVKLTVREPARTDPAPAPSFGATLKMLWGKPSFWHMSLAGALIAFVGYGNAQFLVSNLVRNYGMTIANASYAFGLIAGISVGLGTFLGGFVADRFTAKGPGVLSWLPALGCLIAFPVYVAAMLQTSLMPTLGLFVIAPIFHYFYLSPIFAVAQGVAAPRMRATSAAVMILIVNLIGYALGPPFVGALADYLAGQHLTPQHLDLVSCKGVETGACAAARGFGLRYSMIVTYCVLLWAALHFWLAGRTIKRDWAG